jgi:hypothetical protein
MGVLAIPTLRSSMIARSATKISHALKTSDAMSRNVTGAKHSITYVAYWGHLGPKAAARLLLVQKHCVDIYTRKLAASVGELSLRKWTRSHKAVSIDEAYLFEQEQGIAGRSALSYE